MLQLSDLHPECRQIFIEFAHRCDPAFELSKLISEAGERILRTTHARFGIVRNLKALPAQPRACVCRPRLQDLRKHGRCPEWHPYSGLCKPPIVKEARTAKRFGSPSAIVFARGRGIRSAAPPGYADVADVYVEYQSGSSIEECLITEFSANDRRSYKTDRLITKLWTSSWRRPSAIVLHTHASSPLAYFPVATP